MTQKIKIALLAILFTCTASLVQAQPGGDPNDPDPNNTDIPFDGGLSLIAAASIAYAAKKGYDKRKMKREK